MNLHARITQALKDDAWEGHDEPLTSTDLERIAKVATDAANLAQGGGLLGALVALDRDLHDTEATRLRDGIKALMRVCHIDAANRDQSRKPEEILILRDLEDRLRALLDGEAKG